MRTSGTSRLVGALLVMGSLTPIVTACDGDDPIVPTLDIEELAGLYDPTALTFDPQGSAPAADVLAQIQATQPQLVISKTGGFQIAFLDPVTGFIRTPGGVAEPTTDGVRLLFNNQSDADLLLFPRTLELTHDGIDGSLSFEGDAEVSRDRLLQLFSELYENEQFFSPTPGTLTVRFDLRVPEET